MDRLALHLQVPVGRARGAGRARGEGQSRVSRLESGPSLGSVRLRTGSEPRRVGVRVKAKVEIRVKVRVGTRGWNRFEVRVQGRVDFRESVESRVNTAQERGLRQNLGTSYPAMRHFVSNTACCPPFPSCLQSSHEQLSGLLQLSSH